MIVAKRISFDAAHFLPNYNGVCKNMHGHHWVIELGVEGIVDKDTGMVVDFTNLGAFLKMIKERFDHKVVNDIIENPTAENIATYVKSRYLTSEPILGKQARIKVWETEDSYAEL